ncbi:hypothetical protein N7495_005786 [Penicillium taxi]|uniref:uncharacterized protein n=1 Tax=Penicillium taxi TaxID=168475 RepID=UPI0025452653|nr:uncharacterized protein N7495_005786 [Penicillium taxi]KAJ5894095.1 hypothetical protein N7495_005786 [Penicillium taxi]
MAYDDVTVEFRTHAGRVRLQPCADDGYTWSVAKDNEHLLKTSLSNGSIRVYDDILRGLGHLIEAVTPRTLEPNRQKKVSNAEEKISDMANGSFTATIQRLERENQKLTEKLKRASCYSEELLSKDQDWMRRTCNLEEELKNGQSLVVQLQDELQEARNGMAKAMKVLRQCQKIQNKGPHMAGERKRGL